jgi:hypothetical protein
MNKRDFIAIGVVILLSVIGFLTFTLNQKSGDNVKITVDKQEYGTYPLSKNDEFNIKTDSGYNTVVIENGRVYIKDADCRDKYCVNQGKIKSGSIVCLPHKLVVEVVSDNDSIDAVVK